MYVENIMYGRFNEFECQVSPDTQGNKALRARATLNVLGKLHDTRCPNKKALLNLLKVFLGKFMNLDMNDFEGVHSLKTSPLKPSYINFIVIQTKTCLCF